MAHLLWINNGSERIELGSGSMYLSSSDGYRLLRYVPQDPDISSIDTNSILINGGERPAMSYRNVTENAIVIFSGSSSNDVMDELERLQRMFDWAAHYQSKKSGSRSFINFAPFGSTSPYRSEILSGKVSLIEDSLGTMFTRGEKSIFELVWTRRYFWEGDLKWAKISNRNGTSQTNTVLVNNVSDDDADNFVIIHGSSIQGAIPTPAKISIENHSGGSYANRLYLLSHGIEPYDASSSNSTFGKIYIFEGEDVSGATLVSSTNSSSGAYGSIPYGNGSASQEQLAHWVIPERVSQECAGRAMAVVGRVLGNTDDGANMYIAPVLRTNESEWMRVYNGTEITLSPASDFGVINFGTVVFPQRDPDLPYLSTAVNTTGVYRLALMYRDNSDDVTTTNFHLDFVELLPTDSFRTVRTNSGSVAGDGSGVTIDEIDGVVYQASTCPTASPRDYAKFTTTGKPIYLVPGREQSLTMFVGASPGAGSGMNPGAFHRIKVQYRPRRLTL